MSVLELSYADNELHSPSCLPLLKFLLESEQDDNNKYQKGLFSAIKNASGAVNTDDDKDPIDESYEGWQRWMALVQEAKPQKIQGKSVTIVGGGVSGLCTGFELKRRGFDVRILEASSRVGGRVVTFREPLFAPYLHGEGGAMRIPDNHFLLHKYLDDFGLTKDLFDLEMKNKFIYLSGLEEGKRTLTYDEFNKKLIAHDPEILALFPGLNEGEKGKTCDDLFDAAVKDVKNLWNKVYKQNAKPQTSINPKGPVYDPNAIKLAYEAITEKYDKYSLRSYLTEIAKWSPDAINLYNLGNAHVVFENGFIESLKDSFLSSNKGGSSAGMKQLQQGMDAVPNSFLKAYPDKGVDDSLLNNITFGARVTEIGFSEKRAEIDIKEQPIKVWYDNTAGERITIESDYLVLAIPYTSQRTIKKSKAFSPKQEMAIRDVRYVEVTKVLLQYEQRWWKDIFDSQQQGTDGGVVCDLPIRYTMFPKEYFYSDKEDPSKNVTNPQFKDTDRGAIMAAYTFESDATILGALSPEHRIKVAAQNIDTIFPGNNTLNMLEAGASQVFPADELAGGSAFCYFGPMQKKDYLGTMMETDWDKRVFFAGEQASYTHGWIQGALEAALRCVQQVMDVADLNIS